jgi:ADP-heptose:LPS heptosyltransferase
VAVHPGARRPWNSWPAERFAGLVDYIQGKLGVKAVLLGGERDRGAAEAILSRIESGARSLVGRLGILTVASVLRRAALYVGNDSGPMHIAAAMGTRVVALFGPSDPRVWAPVGEGHVTIHKGIDCRPCFSRGCRRGEESCMRLIGVDEVIHLVERMLDESLAGQERA